MYLIIYWNYSAQIHPYASAPFSKSQDQHGGKAEDPQKNGRMANEERNYINSTWQGAPRLEQVTGPTILCLSPHFLFLFHHQLGNRNIPEKGSWQRYQPLVVKHDLVYRFEFKQHLIQHFSNM